MKSLFVLSIFFLVPTYAVEEKPEEEKSIVSSLEENASEEVALLEKTPLSLPQSNLLGPTEELELSPSFLSPQQKSSFLAVGLTSILPGLGHAYLGDYKTAVSLFGSLGVTSLGYVKKVENILDFSNIIAVQQNTWFYSMYASYRDVRTYNKELGYCYKMPTDSFSDLALAPFRWSLLNKPEVWGAFLGAITLAVGLDYLFAPKEIKLPLFFSTSSIFPLLAFPVGIGEESFFRGYLQSSLSEWLSPWGGIIASSLAFGAMHIPNASVLEPQDRKHYYLVGLPLITAFGTYFGWLTYKNHSLKESVALHSWYDFLLFLANYSTMHSAAIGKTSLAISIPF